MKLQEYCSSGQKRHAFLLTYCIQPAFFEAVALQALIDGGADRVVVLADETEVSNAINAWPPPREVGRRWVLGKSAVTGLFHPKLIARIGRDDALVAILSGNLTSGGWGRNLEVGSAWSVGPMHEDKGGWLASLLKTAQEWTRSPAARQLLREMAEATWLSENELQSGASRDVIFTTGTSRLFDRLSNRWQGRRFDHARIMTGSTDENGALLLELYKAFGVKSAEVFVTKERCSFIDKKIRALPLKVKLRAADSPQVLHAKMIHLSGKAGHVCAWGSANCSAAAWLVPPANGANIEIAVLEDAPDISVLDDLFDKFSGSKEFSGVDQAPDKKPEAPAPTPIRVHGAVYDSRRRTFLFELDVPEGIGNLAAIVHANNIKTRMSLEDEGSGSYFAELNSTETPDQMLSGLIEGRIGENIVCSDLFWIDQSFELAKRASEKDVYRQFKKVNSSVNNGPERLQILSDLLSIAEEVMNDSSGIHLGARPKRDSDKERPAHPLDPSKLVSMIRLVPKNWNNIGSTSNGTSNPSLSIFERLFFDPPEPDEPAIRISDPDTEDYEDRPDAPRPPPQGPPPPTRDEPSQAAVDLESRVKIQGQLTGYLNRLRSPDFARDFHPQRLSDAIFVIIAIAYKAWRGGWLPGEVSGSIAAKLANTLLFETISGHHGLLQAYKSQLSPELLVEYSATLGHGRIWAALLAVLAIEPTSSASNSVLRGSALSQVYNASELIAAADPTSLSGLFDRSIASDLITKALGVAPNVDKAVTTLTEYISAKSQKFLGMQEKYLERAQLFWSRWDGWHYPRQTGWGSVGTAVSLKSAMENDELVRQFVHSVTEAWLVPANPDILADSDISNKPRQ